jgi:hypothetical protein
MLMKLTAGVIFPNILRSAFTGADLKSAKYSLPISLFASVKAERKILVGKIGLRCFAYA